MSAVKSENCTELWLRITYYLHLLADGRKTRENQFSCRDKLQVHDWRRVKNQIKLSSIAMRFKSPIQHKFIDLLHIITAVTLSLSLSLCVCVCVEMRRKQQTTRIS